MVLSLFVALMAVAIFFTAISQPGELTVPPVSPEPQSQIQTSVNQPASLFSLPSGSTIVADPTDPNAVIYTSTTLGVQFSYIIHPEGEANAFELPYEGIPRETGDTVSLDSENYITVFNKGSNNSIEQSIKDHYPQIFQNPYCTVLPDGQNRYVIFDSRVPLTERKDVSLDSTPYQQYEDTICYTPNIWRDFIVDPDFPNKIYLVQDSAVDAPSYSAENGAQWFTTVHLISE